MGEARRPTCRRGRGWPCLPCWALLLLTYRTALPLSPAVAHTTPPHQPSDPTLRLPPLLTTAACTAVCVPLCTAGGVAVLTSPFSWLEQYTDRSNWLGGQYKDGAPLRSADALKAVAAALGLEAVREDEAPLLLREHARKFQLVTAHRIVLRRRQ